MPEPEKRFRCGGCEAAIFENEIGRGSQVVKVKKVSSTVSACPWYPTLYLITAGP